MNGNSLAIDISKINGDQQVITEDSVAVEEPLEIQLISSAADGAAAKSISITMRTPGDDAELALGFLYTEGIIASHTEVADVGHTGPVGDISGQRNTIRVRLGSGVAIDFDRLQRHFYTTSSCGVCGKASLDALKVAGTKSLLDAQPRFPPALITSMPDKLREQQHLFSTTGGLHAAAAFDSSGEIVVLREDVGRHNAVDKVVGWLLSARRLPASDLGLIVSGRASFELMQKALVAGIPLLAAVGAPSSLAVQVAREFDMTLIGFLRGGQFNLYSGGERIL
ncbi:MAG: formate dehydrogenase accessory sulfurtransferase FdhD [Gammaproteobacteria bacterium]|nr:formate dehydrogenase accessory sulfurtransferase FdhD [Gammaproteobacteria bacterium]